jgi:hypothetical protein
MKEHRENNFYQFLAELGSDRSNFTFFNQQGNRLV